MQYMTGHGSYSLASSWILLNPPPHHSNQRVWRDFRWYQMVKTLHPSDSHLLGYTFCNWNLGKRLNCNGFQLNLWVVRLATWNPKVANNGPWCGSEFGQFFASVVCSLCQSMHSSDSLGSSHKACWQPSEVPPVLSKASMRSRSFTRLAVKLGYVIYATEPSISALARTLRTFPPILSFGAERTSPCSWSNVSAIWLQLLSSATTL